MARKPAESARGNPQRPVRKRATAGSAVGQSPLGAAPWGPGPIDPADVENAILSQLGPAADAILRLEHDLESGIVANLAEAESAVEAIDQELGQQIAARFVPAYHALTSIGHDVLTAAKSHMADAAMYLSTVEGEPVHLDTLMTMPVIPPALSVPIAPVPPGKVPHILPPSGPGPQIPVQRPPQRLPTVPPTQPAPPAVVPTAVPGVPGLPPPGWGHVAPTSLVAATGPAQGGAGPIAAPAAVAGTADGVASGAAKAGLIGHNTYDPSTGSFLFEDPDLDPPAAADQWPPSPPAGYMVCPPGVPRFDPSGCMGLTGDALIQCMMSVGQWCAIPGGSPTPAPTPTPPPTPAPTPTPTPPPPPGPTPTPTPPPTPPPPLGPPISPPIVPYPLPPDGSPPPCQPPPGGPGAVGLGPPPAGFAWVWNQSSCSYYAQPAPSPPPPPPPPDGQPPTPQPTPPGGVTIPAPGCGMTRVDPCFVAASSPGTHHPTFNVTPGIAHGMALKDVQPAPLDSGALPDGKLHPTLMDFGNSPLICSSVYQMNLIDPGDQVQDVLPSFKDVLGAYQQSMEGQSVADKVANWAFFMPLGIVLGYFLTFFNKVITYVVSKFYTVNEKLAGDALQRTTVSMLNAICFGGLDRIKRIWDVQANYSFPVNVPSPEAATAAWLADAIDECTFQTYVMAGDQKWQNYRQVATAGKFKFTALDIFALNKRNGMARGTLQGRIRELGSLHVEDLAELDVLARQLPGPGDLIRFMVRDTANAATVERFHMDDNFDANFAGQVKDWADQQSLPEDVMRHNWRAHWSIPAPTQLYVMLHRLRHDPVYSADHDVEGDVREAMIQQDILPYWIDALMKVSYHPLTRTDLNRAYDRGWVNDDDYLNGMYRNGYSDDDAKTLLKFAKNERLLAVKNSDFGTRYIHGLISRLQCLDLAHAEGFDPSLDDAVMEILGPLRDLELQRKQIEGLIHQYKRCWISKPDLMREAQDLEIPTEVVQWQLSWAGEDTTCGSKREMVSALCTALDQGVIGPSEYIERMRLLKYDQHAIDTYLTLCTNKIKAAQAKKQAAEQAAADKEAKKEQAAAEKAAKQAAANAARAAKMMQTAERKRQARNKMLEAAANKLGHDLSDVTDPPSTYVQGLYHQIIDQWHLSQDEAAALLNMASSKAKGMNMGEFTAWVNELAHTSLTEPWLSYFPEPSTPNGHP